VNGTTILRNKKIWIPAAVVCLLGGFALAASLGGGLGDSSSGTSSFSKKMHLAPITEEPPPYMPSPDEPYARCSQVGIAVANASAFVDGSASTPSSRGGPLRYDWSMDSSPCGSSAFLPNAKSGEAVTSFTTQCAGTFTVKLTVTDAGGLYNFSTCQVVATASPLYIVPPAAAVSRGSTVDLAVKFNAPAEGLSSLQFALSYPTNVMTYTTWSRTDTDFDHSVRNDQTNMPGKFLDAISTGLTDQSGLISLMNVRFTISSSAPLGLWHVPIARTFLLPEGRNFTSPAADNLNGQPLVSDTDQAVTDVAIYVQ
jgi:hypothetical protein